MSLPVCGVKYLTWAPYSSPLPLTSRVKHELFSDECENVKDCSTGVPANTAELTKCATCAQKYTNLDRYYGCTWCQEILAPLAASGRALTWTEIQTYINQTKEQRAPVKDTWDALSQCEKGKWVRSTCLANDSQTFPYSSVATGSSTNGSSLSTGAIVGIVIGVVVGLGFIAWAIWFSRLKHNLANEYEQGFHSEAVRTHTDHLKYLAEKNKQTILQANKKKEADIQTFLEEGRRHHINLSQNEHSHEIMFNT